MKILKKAKIKRIITCHICKCVFEIKNLDSYYNPISGNLNARCPTCNSINIVELIGETL